MTVKNLVNILLVLGLAWSGHRLAVSYFGTYQKLWGIKPTYFRETNIMIPDSWVLLAYTEPQGAYKLSFLGFSYIKKDVKINAEKIDKSSFYSIRVNGKKFLLAITKKAPKTEKSPISLYHLVSQGNIDPYYPKLTLEKFSVRIGDAYDLKTSNFIIVPSQYLAITMDNKEKNIAFLKDRLSELILK